MCPSSITPLGLFEGIIFCNIERVRCSLLHLMCAIACEHASTHATNLMRVKIAYTTSVYDTYCLGHWNKENERKIKKIRQPLSKTTTCLRRPMLCPPKHYKTLPSKEVGNKHKATIHKK